jgi:hypothetical protein
MEPLDMPRPRPPGLHREVTRHGKVVWYVRSGHGARIRIRAAFGTPEHQAEIAAALAGSPIMSTGTKFNAQTLGWLIERYRESAGANGTWGNLAPATRRQRESHLQAACAKAGKQPLSLITRVVMERSMAARRPNNAKHFLDTMRGLFKWAAKVDLCAQDPTAGLQVTPQKTDGHRLWPPEWCAAFEARWPLGTWERVAYEILYWTGLRVSDAVRFSRVHIGKNGMGIIDTEKSGERKQRAHIPMHKYPRLLAAIEAGPVGELSFIATANGWPLNKDAFRDRFRRAAHAQRGCPDPAWLAQDQGDAEVGLRCD